MSTFHTDHGNVTNESQIIRQNLYQDELLDTGSIEGLRNERKGAPLKVEKLGWGSKGNHVVEPSDLSVINSRITRKQWWK